MGAATCAKWMRERAVLVGAGLGAVALSAAPAHAVIGIGNATSGNVCANADGPRAAGATRSGTGTVSGNAGQLPLGLPRNHCGNSGLTCTAATNPFLYQAKQDEEAAARTDVFNQVLNSLKAFGG
ncbi:chaplin family protein [Streptomyces sp. NPDC046261]|uniref:chaplin family protein n=1 Tax=Streptomyces sp. NPDC046261 TaxID=3157200 RepID=UPI0033DAFFA7